MDAEQGTSRSRDSGVTRVRVGAFGVHRAWLAPLEPADDAGVGVRPVSLMLGFDGGVAPAPGGPALIVRVHAGEIVAARAWASVDRRGASGCMVVFAVCVGASLSWVLEETLPRLQRLERRCRDATRSEALASAVAATEDELRGRWGSGGGEAATSAGVRGALDAAGSREEFYRLMRRVELSWSGYLAAAAGDAQGARRVRVPAGPGDSVAVVTRWVAFARSILRAGIAVTVVQGGGGRGVELLAGDPRAPEEPAPEEPKDEATAPDAAARERWDGLVQEERPFPEAEVGAVVAEAGVGAGRMRVAMVVVVALVLIGAGVWIVWLFSGNGKGSGGGAPVTLTPDAREQAAPAAADERTLKAWEQLCASYAEWFGVFRRSLAEPVHGEQRGAWYSRDDDLQAIVERVQSAGMNPWSIAGVGAGRDLAWLASHPPESLRDREVAESVVEAAAYVSELPARLRDSWGTAGEIMTRAEVIERAGYGEEGGALRVAVGRMRSGSDGTLVAGVDAVLEASEVSAAIVLRLETLRSCVMELEATGDATLARFGAWARQEAPPAQGESGEETVRTLRVRLEAVVALAVEVRAFVRASWMHVDAELVAATAASDAVVGAANVGRSTFLAWMRIAEQCPRVDQEDDPREAAGTDDQAARAARLIDDVKGPDPRSAAAAQARLDAAVSTLDGVRSLVFNARTRSTIEAAVERSEYLVSRVTLSLRYDAAMVECRRATRGAEIREVVKRCTGRVLEGDDTEELRSKALLFIGAFRDIEHAVPAPLELAGDLGVGDEIARRSVDIRDSFLEQSTEWWTPENVAERAPSETAVCVKEYTKARAGLESLLNDLRVIGARLDAGRPLSGRSESGEPLASVLERARRGAEEFGANGEHVAATLEAAAGLERVETLVGERELAAVIEQATAARWFVALGAWRRLGQGGAGASLRTMEVEAWAAQRVLDLIDRANPPERARLRGAVYADLSDRWAADFSAFSTPEEIEGGAALRGAMAGREESLSTRARYNLALAELRVGVRGVVVEARVRELASAFLKRTATLEVEGAPGTRQLQERIRACLEGGVSLSEGPASVVSRLRGALCETTEDGVRVILGGDAPAMEFTRVEAPQKRQGYLAISEVSVALARGILDNAGGDAWAEFRLFFPARRETQGPRTWAWGDDGRLRPAPAWPGAAAGGVDGAALPLNFIPPGAAIYLAHLCGCRLATLDEYRAALAATGALEDMKTHNLRDQAWDGALRAVGTGATMPDADAFVPTTGDRRWVGPGAPSNPWDDGIVWFAPVHKGKGNARHLVGNVAEFVAEGTAGDLVAPVTGASAEYVRGWVSRNADRLRVIGGSAISPVQVRVDEAYPLDPQDAAGGYADVGFRLAFSSMPGDEQPLGIRLMRALEESGYVMPISKK